MMKLAEEKITKDFLCFLELNSNFAHLQIWAKSSKKNQRWAKLEFNFSEARKKCHSLTVNCSFWCQKPFLFPPKLSLKEKRGGGREKAKKAADWDDIWQQTTKLFSPHFVKRRKNFASKIFLVIENKFKLTLYVCINWPGLESF